MIKGPISFKINSKVFRWTLTRDLNSSASHVTYPLDHTSLCAVRFTLGSQHPPPLRKMQLLQHYCPRRWWGPPHFDRQFRPTFIPSQFSPSLLRRLFEAHIKFSKSNATFLFRSMLQKKFFVDIFVILVR